MSEDRDKLLITFEASVVAQMDENHNKVLRVQKKAIAFPGATQRFLDREYGWEHYEFSVFWRELGRMVRTAVTDNRKVSVVDVAITRERVPWYEAPDIEDGLEIIKAERAEST